MATYKKARFLLIPLLAACVYAAFFTTRSATPVSAADLESKGGSLQVMDSQGRQTGTCPLEHTDVRATVSGFISRVTVTQRFGNPYKHKIEAVYTFPLPSEAAVDDMTMTVGDREIRGEIKRREEARRIYDAAREAGHVASLLDQERPNIFTQSVANIMPGENVTVTISYVAPLTFKDGWFEFRFPMVVGPRYIPGQPTSAAPKVPEELKGKVVEPKVAQGSAAPKGTGWAPDTDKVPDASNITPPVTAPGTRAGHDISLSVEIDAGTKIRDIQSKLHEVSVQRDGEKATVSLRDQATIPNKDFILRYTTATGTVSDSLLTHASDAGKYFMLVLQPPDRVRPAQVTPKEMVFVLDTSGSMQGAPIEAAKETMFHCIRNLNRKDTFNLITFAGDTRILFGSPVPATAANIKKAQSFLSEQSGSGGTEMMKAITAALTPSDDKSRIRIVCFMTDGYVGNDMEIIDEIQKHSDARIFSFGIGQSVNKFLLDGMARAGRGEVDYVNLGDPGKEIASRFYERLRNPVLTDIRIDWGGLPVKELYPARIPDLFSSQPVVVVGQADGAASGEITLSGNLGGRPFQRKIRVELPAEQPDNGVLASLWARRKIEDIMSEDWLGAQLGKPSGDIAERVTELGLKYRLMTQYTSFVAVEWTTVTEGGVPRKVPVPVEMPEGVSYQGVFGEEGDAIASMIAPGGSGGYSGRAVGKASASMALPSPSAPIVEREMDRQATMGPPAHAKLSTELQKLLDSGTAPAGVSVKDGNVEVTIRLSSDSDADLANLKTIGVTVLAHAKSAKTLVARVPVKALEELEKLAFVVWVEPVRS